MHEAQAVHEVVAGQTTRGEFDELRQDVAELKQDMAAPATQLFDFLLLYEERLVRERDGHLP